MAQERGVVSSDDMPGDVEPEDRDADWVFWPPPGEGVDTGGLCDCGHEGLGPSWHAYGCACLAFVWKKRAFDLHNRLWDLLEGSSRRPRPARPARPPAPEHGTLSAYNRCRQRLEGSCEECKAAKRAYIDRWKDRRDPNRKRRATRADGRRSDPRPRTELPGGGYAEQEWKRLSPKQRDGFMDLARQQIGGDVNSWNSHALRLGSGIATYRALTARGLLPDRGHVLTKRGRALATWAIENGTASDQA